MAVLLVAFAGIAGTPARINAGNVNMLPPPATLLIAPANNATPARTASVVTAEMLLPRTRSGLIALGDAVDRADFFEVLEFVEQLL